MESFFNLEPEKIKEFNAIGFFPSAIPRQFMAILATGDRSELVKTIKVKTLVIHGKDDPLLPIAHGEYTARLIKGSKFVAIEDMEHSIKGDNIEKVLKAIERHISSFEENTNKTVLMPSGNSHVETMIQ